MVLNKIIKISFISALNAHFHQNAFLFYSVFSKSQEKNQIFYFCLFYDKQEQIDIKIKNIIIKIIP